MALNKTQLKTEIHQLMTEMRTKTSNSDEEYADRLATAIDNYVKTATITYIAGLVAPSGAVTGVFNGKLE